MMAGYLTSVKVRAASTDGDPEGDAYAFVKIFEKPGLTWGTGDIKVKPEYQIFGVEFNAAASDRLADFAREEGDPMTDFADSLAHGHLGVLARRSLKRRRRAAAPSRPPSPPPQTAEARRRRRRPRQTAASSQTGAAARSTGGSAAARGGARAAAELVVHLAEQAVERLDRRDAAVDRLGVAAPDARSRRRRAQPEVAEAAQRRVRRGSRRRCSTSSRSRGPSAPTAGRPCVSTTSAAVSASAVG